MSRDQRFEYRRLASENSGSLNDLEEQINGLAAEGWRLVETVESSGHTVEYLFERPVDHGE